MEQNQNTSLFDMNMDSTAQGHLLSVSKWTKFIAITAFITIGIILLLVLANGSEILNSISALSSLGGGDIDSFALVILLVVVVILVLWVYFLLSASTNLKKGLESRNTAIIAEGFKSMRIYFVISFVISILSLLSSLQTMF